MPLTGNPKVRGIIVDVLNRGNGCLGCHKIIDGWGCLLKNDYFCKKIYESWFIREILK